MGKGFLSPLDTSTRYVQEFSPWRSPELWRDAVKIFFTGFAAGIVVFAVVIAKSDLAIVDNTDPRVQPTVTVTVTHKSKAKQ